MGNEISYGGGGGGGGGGGPPGNSMFRSSNPSTAGGQIETMGGSTFQA
eukprot:CAMPEP_0113907730 /NCGR_PEP_ID=MMETSP0780_2-20120614/25683_1 /TAXON_ID=652834 /ORGANISM="Palpitomonas bilix" /LENGTH=47 /DNA_ID=CAMNT_0000902909 /DNA_START=210 /DNA_END=354 /DNA_ORIENTATION=+ /assembly_acc=CAM_ASM_000599